MLERVLQAHPAQGQADAVTMLAAAVAKSAVAPSVQRVLARVGDEGTPAWQRSALLQGLDTGLPAAGGGRGAVAEAAVSRSRSSSSRCRRNRLSSRGWPR